MLGTHPRVRRPTNHREPRGCYTRMHYAWPSTWYEFYAGRPGRKHFRLHYIRSCLDTWFCTDNLFEIKGKGKWIYIGPIYSALFVVTSIKFYLQIGLYHACLCLYLTSVHQMALYNWLVMALATFGVTDPTRKDERLSLLSWLIYIADGLPTLVTRQLYRSLQRMRRKSSLIKDQSSTTSPRRDGSRRGGGGKRNTCYPQSPKYFFTNGNGPFTRLALLGL